MLLYVTGEILPTIGHRYRDSQAVLQHAVMQQYGVDRN